MKATGIVRRIDDLGRVVIPKEIRRTMRIREGDPLEIYTDSDGEVIFKKYSPLGELNNFSSQYAEVLYRNAGYPVVVCDRDHVIAVAGLPKKELIERRVSPTLEDKMEQRKTFVCDMTSGEKVQPVEGVDRYALVGAPIISSGDVCGSIMLMSDGHTNGESNEVSVKLINTAAAFLGKQMEE
jgi:AbrB family transcriptional regulator (stage V sporulation protein T)